jgi:thiamine-phosphate pyrophosphorylase
MQDALAQGGIYVITDARLIAGEQLLTAVAAALRGGAALVQYRDKGDRIKERSRRRREATALLALCHEQQVPLIINDDIELAAAIAADGVHLGREDASPALARQRLGHDAIIGISGYADPRAALTVEADYIAFGRLFESYTKPQASPASLHTLRTARTLTHKPIVGIGGINRHNAAQVAAAGANWLAVVNAVFDSQDIEASTRALCSALNQQI